MLKPRSHAGVGLRRGAVVNTADVLASTFRPWPIRPGNDSVLAVDPDVALPLVQHYYELGTADVISVTGYLDRAGELAAVGYARKVSQSPRRLGVGTMFEPVATPPFADAAVDLVRSIQGTGIFELEVLVERATGAHVALDLNPRAFGQMSLDIGRGNDLPLLWYNDVAGTSLRSSHPSPAPGPAVARRHRVLRRLRRALPAGPAPRRHRPPRVGSHRRSHRRGDARLGRSAAWLPVRGRSPPPPSGVHAPVPRRQRAAGHRGPAPGAGGPGARPAAMIGRLLRHGRAVAKDRIGPFIARRQPTRTDLPLGTWGLEVGPNGTVWSDGVDLAALAAEHGTPLHVVRGDRLDANATAAMAASEAADVFSSYKTNPVPAVLARLHGHGIGAEVISPYELWLAMRLGVPGERIIYNGPAKSPASIRAAIRHGALLVNANSVSEARLIASIAADEQRVVNLGLRIAVPGAWVGQFGIPDIAAAADAVRAALDDPWVALRGLHVHRGLTIRTRGDDGRLRRRRARAGRRAAGADRLEPGDPRPRRQPGLPDVELAADPPAPAQPGARDRPPPAGPDRLRAHRRRRPPGRRARRT